MPDPQQMLYLMLQNMQSQQGAFGSLPQRQQMPGANYMRGGGDQYMSPFQPFYGNAPRAFWQSSQSSMMPPEMQQMLEAGMGVFAKPLEAAMQSRGMMTTGGDFGSVSDIYSRRQQNSRTQITKATAEDDRRRLTDTLKLTLMQMKPDMDAEKAANFAADASSSVYDFMDSPVGKMLDAPAILDKLGIQVKSGERLAQAAALGGRSMGMYTDPAMAARTSKAIMGKYYEATPEGGRQVNQSYAAGMTISDMSQTMKLLGQEGMLEVNNPEQIAEKMRGVNRTMGLMRELLGSPNAPIKQVFESIQAITGGAVGQLSEGEVQTMISRTSSLGRALAISPEQATTFMSASIADAQARGMMGIEGARSAQAALGEEVAVRQSQVDRGVAGRTRIGASTVPQRIDNALKRAQTYRVSQIGMGSSILARMVEDFGPRMAQSAGGKEVIDLLNKHEQGTITETETRRLGELTTDTNLQRIGTDVAGMTGTQAASYRRNYGAAEVAATRRDLFNPISRSRAERTYAVEKVVGGMDAGTQAQMGGRESATAIVSQILSTGASKEQALEIIKSRAAKGANAAAIYSSLEDSANANIGNQVGNRRIALSTAGDIYSDAAIRRKASNRELEGSDAELRDLFLDAGFAPKRGGLVKKLIGGLAAKAEGGKLNKDLLETMAEVGGFGVGGERKEAFKSQVIDKFDEQTAKMEEDLRVGKESGSLTADEIGIQGTVIAGRKRRSETLHKIYSPSKATEEEAVAGTKEQQAEVKEKAKEEAKNSASKLDKEADSTKTVGKGAQTVKLTLNVTESTVKKFGPLIMEGTMEMA